MSNNVKDFSTLKFFYVCTRPEKVVTPIQVFWWFLEVGWIKVNTNDVVWGSPDLTTCGGNFKGSCGEYIRELSASFRDPYCLIW